MNPVSELALAALGGAEELPFYARALRRACEASPPPYGQRWFGDEFRRRARDPRWFAGLLRSDARLEGYSAGQLWQFASTVSDPGFAEAARRHARDEARHAKLFGRLLLTVFPRLDAPERREELASFVPQLGAEQPSERASEDELLFAVALINLHEVQALVLERLLAPALEAYAEPEDRRRVQASADVLIRDEVEHIRYTARFLESAGRARPDAVEAALVEFQATLGELSREDVERTRGLALV